MTSKNQTISNIHIKCNVLKTKLSEFSLNAILLNRYQLLFF
jgi:hypothetical protein